MDLDGPGSHVSSAVLVRNMQSHACSRAALANPEDHDLFFLLNKTRTPYPLPPRVPAPGECTPAGGAWLQAPSPNTSLAVCAREVLAAADPWEKIARAHGAFAALNNGLPIGTAVLWSGPPARPSKPRLVPAREVPGPKEAGLPLNAYMLHNLAHIELNAIDLAMDTVLRFCHYPMPRAFFADFARVADEEARHLGWCLQVRGEVFGLGWVVFAAVVLAGVTNPFTPPPPTHDVCHPAIYATPPYPLNGTTL